MCIRDRELTAPLGVPAIRFLLAGLGLAAFALVTEGRIPRPQTGSEWGMVSGLAMTGIFLYALCFFYGLKHITAGRGALVVALTPVVVVLTAWFLGRERMNALKLAGVAIAMAGCLTAVSYTHLDVYKRQDGDLRRGLRRQLQLQSRSAG